jgi:hypothetical protein
MITNSTTFNVIKVSTYSEIPASFSEDICYYTIDTDKHYAYKNSNIIEIFESLNSLTLDGYIASPGVVSASDTILTAIEKLDGNIAAISAGSGITRSIQSIAVNTAAGSTAATDYVYLVSGPTTLTLPTAVGNTNKYEIKRTGVNTVSIATTGGQTIDSSASPITINVQYASISVISDGANWFII